MENSTSPTDGPSFESGASEGEVESAGEYAELDMHAQSERPRPMRRGRTWRLEPTRARPSERRAAADRARDHRV